MVSTVISGSLWIYIRVLFPRSVPLYRSSHRHRLASRSNFDVIGCRFVGSDGEISQASCNVEYIRCVRIMRGWALMLFPAHRCVQRSEPPLQHSECAHTSLMQRFGEPQLWTWSLILTSVILGTYKILKYRTNVALCSRLPGKVFSKNRSGRYALSPKTPCFRPFQRSSYSLTILGRTCKISKHDIAFLTLSVRCTLGKRCSNKWYSISNSANTDRMVSFHKTTCNTGQENFNFSANLFTFNFSNTISALNFTCVLHMASTTSGIPQIPKI